MAVGPVAVPGGSGGNSGVGGVGLGLWQRLHPRGTGTGSPGIPVKVETAKLISVNDTTEYVSTLKSRATAVIMPQVEGVITDIYVHSGSRVSAGTP